MNEGAGVIAHVHAVKPSAARRRDSGQAQAAHGVPAVALVEDDVGVEAAHREVVPPDVVRLAVDVLDQVQPMTVIAHRVEVEESGQVDPADHPQCRRLDQKKMRRGGHIVAGRVISLDDEPVPVGRKSARNAGQGGVGKPVCMTERERRKGCAGLGVGVDERGGGDGVEVLPVG